MVMIMTYHFESKSFEQDNYEQEVKKLVELHGTSSTEELENIFTDLEGKDNDRK